ncbi:MAG: endonuclease [Ruminococcaceae bacterium]|nr:endonuclease [Oscillospiraceae bacterium]
MSEIIRIPTINMSHEEWLEERRKSIGGSDAAAIIGLNQWSSPYRVWADKTGRLPEIPDNEAMRQGRDLEDYVAQRWCEVTGKKVRRSNFIIRNTAYPFAHADVDRFVVGEDAGLECKTTSVMNLKNFKGGAYPEHYYVQCVHYMAVTGAKRWYLGVLVLNQGFYEFTIERDEEEIRALMEQELDFWKFVETDSPPPADGSDATMDALQTIYADSNSEGLVNLFGRDSLIQEYFSQRDIKNEATNRMEEIKQTLIIDLGENETGMCGSHKVTWKPQTRRTFNDKSFAEDYPDLPLEDYYKISSFRTFKIREVS